MVAGVRDLEQARAAFAPLAATGYEYTPHRPRTHHFSKGSPPAYTHQLHLTEPGSDLWLERLAFRDALRASPELAAEYGELKLRLAGDPAQLHGLANARSSPAYSRGPDRDSAVEPSLSRPFRRWAECSGTDYVTIETTNPAGFDGSSATLCNIRLGFAAVRRGSILQLVFIGVVAGAIATAVAIFVPWLPTPATKEAGRIKFVFWFTIVICLFIFSVVAAISSTR